MNTETITIIAVVAICLSLVIGLGIFIWIKRKDEEIPPLLISGPSGPSGPSVVTPGPSGPMGPSGPSPVTGPQPDPSPTGFTSPGPSPVTGPQPDHSPTGFAAPGPARTPGPSGATGPSSSFRYTQSKTVGTCNVHEVKTSFNDSNYLLTMGVGNNAFTETYLQIDNSDIFKIEFTALGLYYGNFVDGSNVVKLPSAFPTKYKNSLITYLCNAGTYTPV